MQQTYNVKIGEVIVTSKGTVLQATLGSCVSVCLFDPQTGVGGMIHCASSLESETHASRNCLNSLRELFRALKSVSERSISCYKAKIVGGANEETSKFGAGADNIKQCLQELKDKGIEVVGKDVGGSASRKIFFFPATGQLKVATIEKERMPAKKEVVVSKPKKTRVFIVDDSKTIQTLLVKIFKKNPRIEVVGVASDPIEAMEKLQTLSVDVITLDINMPRMSGIQFLEVFLPKKPLPIVLISSLSMSDGGAVLKGLELGAVDYIQKPRFEDLEQEASVICDKIVSAGNIAHKFISKGGFSPVSGSGKNLEFEKDIFLAIGASTGGTEAIKSLLTNLPTNIPPTVIVQHIPPVFSKAFADRVNGLCPFLVKEAEDGEELSKNKVLIAPGGKQMKVRKAYGKFYIQITDDPPVNRHRPSVDYLFNSVAKNIKSKAIGVILTGMGEDGAKGLLEMREAGSHTVAQDEESCVVFGMPREAIKMGAAEKVESLEDIPSVLARFGVKKNAA